MEEQVKIVEFEIVVKYYEIVKEARKRQRDIILVENERNYSDYSIVNDMNSVYTVAYNYHERKIISCNMFISSIRRFNRVLSRITSYTELTFDEREYFEKTKENAESLIIMTQLL